MYTHFLNMRDNILVGYIVKPIYFSALITKGLPQSVGPKASPRSSQNT